MRRPLLACLLLFACSHAAREPDQSPRVGGGAVAASSSSVSAWAWCASGDASCGIQRGPGTARGDYLAAAAGGLYIDAIHGACRMVDAGEVCCREQFDDAGVAVRKCHLGAPW